MKTIKIILITISTIFVMLSSCDTNNKYFDTRLKVINNSDKAIYADFYQSYPDTTLSKLFHFANSAHKVMPHETFTLGRGGTWEQAFQEQIYQKLLVYIFDAVVVDNTPWDTIRKNYLILKRYELTLKELDSLNFKIIYP